MNEPDQDPTVEYRPNADPTAPGWGAGRDAGGLPSFTPGSTLGRFRIVRTLGQGGMGQVFEADDLDSGRRVALKILARPASSQTERSRFLREGRLAASINHPNCVYVFGTEELDGLPVIAMELVPEGTLADRVATKGPLEADEALRAILQVVAGLEAAHEAGVLHRDVKPSNCFLDGRGGVKVGDFGLSVPSHGREDETQLTVAGTFLGTPAYASPEQLHGHALDVRSDIYAVGATLYYLLTGRPPFDQSNPVTLVAAILQEEPQSPSALRGGVPVGLARVVLRCLAKSPAGRYQSYADLHAALSPFVRTRQAPAELGLRLLAWIVDWSPWLVLSVGISFFRSDLTTNLSFMLGSLLTSTAYFAVTEGIWGAGVGKRLAGIRVVGPDGQSPGLARATLRALVFTLVPAAPNLTMRLLSANGETYWQFMQTAPGQLVAVSGGLLALALFSTARRPNGFAALHELASGTRVVRRHVSIHRPQMKEEAHAVAAGLREGPASVGPYRITGEVDPRVLVGVDPALGREVWIRLGGPGEPLVPEERRALDRSTRLRWLSGRRKTEESWDAFEAPGGAPLVEVLARPQAWSTVRHWLLDVAEELAAGRADGTLPTALGLAHVWITPQGGARLIDFPVGPEGSAAPVGGDDSGRALLAAIAQRALAQIPLPLHARSLIDDLSSERGQDLSRLLERLRQAAGEAPALGRARRAAHLASANAMLLVVLIPAVLSVGFVLDPSIGLMKELVVCLQAFPAARTDAEREAIEVYVAGRFDSFSDLANVLRDPPLSPSSTGLRSNIAAGALRGALERPEERARLLAIYDRKLEPSPAQVRDAEQALPTELRTRLEEIRSNSASRGDGDLLPAMTAFIGTLLVCLWSGLHALACPLFRGGPLIHVFGIAIVTRTGTRASRLRLLARGVLLWLPFGLCCTAAWLLVRAAKQATLAPGPVWGAVWLLALIPLAALIACVVTPDRGPHDRLAGTYLVPR
jgi:hypothetical protein